MIYLLGTVIVFASIFGGYSAMGGNLLVLWQPFEFVIIVGAAFGSFLISNNLSTVKATVSSVFGLAKGKPHSKKEYLELLSLLSILFTKARQNIQSIESDLDAPDKSPLFQSFEFVRKNPKSARFVADYMRIHLLEKTQSHEIESLFETEIETIEHELNRVPQALSNVAESLPALGIVAAVLGIIKAMSAISQPPEVLGGLIGGALVGTLLGVFLSYGLVGPIATAIRQRNDQELTYYISIKTAMIAFLNNYQVQMCVEFARKTIDTEVRPEFEEVEQAISRAKAKSA